MKKRIISLLLCVVLLMGLLPTSALASSSSHYANYDSVSWETWTDESTKHTYRYTVYQESGTADSLYAELTAVTLNAAATEINLTIPEDLPYTPNGGTKKQVPLRVISDAVSSDVLKSVSIPASVEIIGEGAFQNSCQLAAVTFEADSQLKTIGNKAFYNCALTSVVIPDSVQTIGDAAFWKQGYTAGKDTLTSLTLGRGVQTIGEEAFGRNTKLNQNGTLDLPNSLTSIGRNAFVECSFSSITWPENPGFTEIKGFSYCNNLTGDVLENLPGSVNSIGMEAFTGCTGITQLTIPTAIQTIGERAFRDCTALTDLTIRNGVLTIGYDAFAGCTGLLGKSIEIPASVTTVFSGAFAGIYDAAKPGEQTLTISILNPAVVFPSDNTGATGYDYRYDYYEAEDTSHSNKKSAADPFAHCAQLVLRAPEGSAAKSYADAKNGTVFKLGANNNFYPRSVTFQEIGASAAPVQYIVTLPTETDVTFTVKQEGENLTLSGNTAQALSGKDVVVTAHKEGYYDQVLVKRGADFTEDWTVTAAQLGEWKPIPVSNRLLVNITRPVSITKNGVTKVEELPLGSFDGLNLSLTKKVDNTDEPIANVSSSYPYLVLPKDHGLDASANLTLTVTPGDSMQLSGGTATLQNGSFTLALQSWGKAAITATGTTYAPCVVILFDGAGKAVSSGITSGGVFTSDPLPAGTYTAVAYETNDYFGAVGSKTALTALGLTAGDYAEGSVTITNGNTDKLTLTVPKLNTKNLTSALDTGKCSVVFRSNQAVTGVTFNMQVNYGLTTNTDEVKKITFTLPDGAIIQSVYDESKKLDVTSNSVTVTNSSGTLYVSMKCTETGSKNFGASITTDGKTLPLGSGTVTVQDIFLNAAESYTAKRDGNRVEVYTSPNTTVNVTVPGGRITNTEPLQTNSVGRLTLTYDLPQNAAYGQSFTLTATANGGSDRTSITYFPASAELKQLGFRQCGSDVRVIDNDDPGKEAKYYTYIAFGDEASKYFSLYATFKANQLLNVTVIVTMQDGSVRSVPLTLIDEADGIQTYAGELYLPGNSGDHVFHADSIPVGFEISWEEPVAPKPDGNTIYAQAAARAAERQSVRDDIWPETLGSESLTLTSEDLKQILIAARGENAVISDAEMADIEETAALLTSPYTPSFLGGSYRMTDTDLFKQGLLTKEEYEALKPQIDPCETDTLNDLYSKGSEYLADAYAVDALMDEAAVALSNMLQLNRPLYDYSGLDEILGEMGVEYSEGKTYTDNDLTGFTQMGDFWYKDDGKGKITAVWPNGFTAGSETAAAALGLEETPSVSMYAARETGNGVQLSWDSTSKALEGNLSDQTRAAAGYALSHAADRLKDLADEDVKEANRLRNLQQELTTPQFKKRVGKMADARTASAKINSNKMMLTKGLNRSLSAYNLVSDADQLNENIVATAESKAKASELEPLIQYYTMHGDVSGCLDAMIKEQKGYESLNTLMDLKSKHLICNMGMNLVATITDVFSAGTGGKVFLAYDVASGALMVSNDILIAELQKAVDNLSAKRQSLCGDWRKLPKRNLTPILDPSGIVYEAVESNVLSGVTATIWKKGDDDLWSVWDDAADYGQTKQQTTGVSGGYAWDVPSGTWKVKFTKEGYEDAATNELTVPPPRMNLKTAMESIAAPTVVSAAAYPDYVELVFSQYMSTMETLTVPEGYTYEWMNAEKVSAANPTEYSKVLHLIPESAAALGTTVSFTLSGAVNYADTALEEYSSDTLTVAVEPAALKLNYETQIAVLVGEEKDPRVTVQVLDSSNRPISGLKVTAAIEDDAYAAITTEQSTTGEDGVAVFSVKGKLPGWTKATFAVKDSSLAQTMPVRITINSNQVAKPVASIGGQDYTESTNSITVPRGSTLTLTCATEGAVIYYTTNDTCPCQAMDRQTYTGPITVNEDTYFRIAAYKNGMEYSERLNLRVHVTDASSGGGGGSATPGSSTAVKQSENGSVTVTPQNAKKGDTVTLTTASEPGYVLKSLNVTDSSNKPVEVTKTTDGKFTFVMPAGSVAIQAEFANVSEVFTDVPADSYYTEAVAWAVENGVTVGTNTDGTLFSPDTPCTRAQIVTFLWRAAGSPEPKGTQNFGDVTAGSYYEKAVAWAAENGITGGTGDGKFSPDATCTRAQAVTFLYRAGSASAVSGGTVFTDVAPGAYYADAVAWAAENGITGGIGGGLFAPGSNCTRAQIVTFLYRSVK